MLEDAELLRRYAEQGSENAFTELVRRRIDLVYSAALRQVRGDVHLAREVTQIVFTQLGRKASSIQNHPVLAGWLYRSTRFAAIDALRNRARRIAREREAQTMNEILSDPGATVDWAHLQPVVDRALNELPERDRDAVLLRFFDGLSFAQVGRQLGMAENTARMRVDRALDRVRIALIKQGLTSTSAALAILISKNAVAAAPEWLAGTVSQQAFASLAVSKGGAVAQLLNKIVNLKKIAVSVVGVMAFVGIGASVFETQKACLIQTRYDHLARTADESRQRLTDAERNIRSLQAALNQARRVSRDDSVGVKPAVRSTARPPETAFEFKDLSRSPSLLKGARDMVELRALQKFDGLRLFFAAHGVSVAVQERLKQILIAGEMAGLDFEATARSQGFTGAEPSTAAAFRQIPIQTAAEIQTLLGNDLYQQYQAYDASLPQRKSATALSGMLSYTDSPLTALQAQQLVQILAQQTIAAGAPSDAITDDAIERASGFLSPPQVTALQQLQVSQRLQAEMNAAFNAAKLATDGSQSPPK